MHRKRSRRVPGKVALSLAHGCAYHPEALRVSIPAGYGSLWQLHHVGWEIILSISSPFPLPRGCEWDRTESPYCPILPSSFWQPAPAWKPSWWGGDPPVISLTYSGHFYHSRDSKGLKALESGTRTKTKFIIKMLLSPHHSGNYWGFRSSYQEQYQICVSDYITLSQYFTSVIFLSQTHNPNPITRKPVGKCPSWDILQYTWLSSQTRGVCEPIIG